MEDFIVGKLIGDVGAAIGENEGDPDTLSHARWFGSHLKAFLRRVVHERPRAARSVLRFITTYSRDVYRRTAAQGTVLGGKSRRVPGIDDSLSGGGSSGKVIRLPRSA